VLEAATDDRRPLVTMAEAARAWHISRAHIYRLKSRCLIPTVTIGGCDRIHPAIVDYVRLHGIPEE